MPNFAGFDKLGFPGLDQMTWLKANTNLAWCGYYLAPAPSHSDRSWMGTRQALVGLGWGIAPLYVGQQTAGPGSHEVDAAQGTVDGAHACALASREGFATGTSIYIDIEDGSNLSPDASAYLTNWAKAVAAGGYAPACYCSHRIAASVAALAAKAGASLARVWAFKVPTTDPHDYGGDIDAFPTAAPAGSGFAGATMWQYEQNIALALPGAPVLAMTVDLSSASMADPGAPAGG